MVALVAVGVGQCSNSAETQDADPAIVIEHRQRLRKHRGLAVSFVRRYSRNAADLLAAIDDDSG